MSEQGQLFNTEVNVKQFDKEDAARRIAEAAARNPYMGPLIRRSYLEELEYQRLMAEADLDSTEPPAA